MTKLDFVKELNAFEDDSFTELLMKLSTDKIREVDLQNPNCSVLDLLGKIGLIFFDKFNEPDNFYSSLVQGMIVDYFGNVNVVSEKYLMIRGKEILVSSIIPIMFDYIEQVNVYKFYREKYNFTYKEIANHINVNEVTIKRWEEIPSHPKIGNMARIR